MGEDRGSAIADSVRMSRRQLLTVFGAATAAVTAQSLLTGGPMLADGQTVTGQTYGNNGNCDCAFRTLTELQASVQLADGMIAVTYGYYAAGDGGGAVYMIAAGTLPEDGGSVVTLQNGLQARLFPGASVNYRIFGAVGDGVNDDGVQIKKAHAYANKAGLPVEHTSGDYWLKATNKIEIRTNVNWGATRFHIDESFNSKSDMKFMITSAKPSSAIVLDPAAKASLIAKLRPGTTQLPELAPYKNCLVFVVDKNDIVARREGYGTQWSKEEFFYVEEHGRIVGDIAWTFQDYTSLTAYPCDDGYLIIDGGTFYLSGNSPGSNQGYWNNGFQIRRSRTVIRNQWVGLEAGQADTALDPRNGFYTFNYAYEVLLDNVRLIPYEKDRGGSGQVPQGTYGIGGNRVLRATFRGVTAEGSKVHWGVFGTNMFKDFRVENCKLNRVDVHFHCWNLYIRDCEIGYRGLSLTGGGQLFVENTTRYGNNFIDFRPDYGARWDGDIRIRNCRIVVPHSGSMASVLYYNPSNYDYKCTIGYGRTIRIEDFIFDFSGAPAAVFPCWIMKLAAFSKTDEGQRLFFPVQLECRNISVHGREQGVRLLEIKDPRSFDVRRKGGYDEQKVTPNCSMRFEHIQLEKVPVQTSQSAAHVHFLLNALGSQAYDDEYALYPFIEIIDCRDFFGHFKGSIADVRFQSCLINCIDAYEGGAMRGRIAFDHCDFRADALDDGRNFLFLAATLGTRLTNCTVHAPIVNGSSRPDLVSRYEFLQVNQTLRYNHTNTKLAKELTDYYANAGTPVEPEFTLMLRSRHESESPYMLRRKGTTAQRPSASTLGSEKGFSYFDTELNQLLVWDGTRWVNPSRRTESLHFYAASAAGGAIPIRMERLAGHPTQEYLMPKAGRLPGYAAYAEAGGGTVPDVVFEVLKNGVPWLAGLNGPSGGQTYVIAPIAGSSDFAGGDRIGVRITGISGTSPLAGFIVDLNAEFVNY
ncbi:hypothetical protein [Paenibacillus ginsengarvi]|uniref:Pectate lyase superfamily protein domain-containing protein n=1 Tax=Paenibacillus ginsengarvi TaxID=400777 RepID=A0A3B0CKJ6_9BACL|nr:hypothetical protein [Paenibacillus ginsengarvi]RKN85500.1 hypothetical protein D7M11_07380 [Paenibacillus ginsengarvi]